MLDAVRAGATLQGARDGALANLIERDRRLAYELAAGVLRRRAQLDRMLELASADPRLHDVLRLGAYQLRALARVPAYAAVSTSVELAREVTGEGGARYVNHVLRRLARDAGSGMRDAEGTHPLWLVVRWRARFGVDETSQLIAWNDARPGLTLQPVRWDCDTLHTRLREAGFGVAHAPFGAGLQVVPGAHASRIPHPAQLPGFDEGAFIVQDPAHALVCRFAAIPPGAIVYDACAAPGGKAATLERGGARVIAGDARRERIGRLVETTRRAGVAIRVAVADLLAAPFRSDMLAAVLVDAPCSATGTMARHPDARWRLTPRTIARAAERQRALLAAAAALVRPGALLVYATCSLEPEENGDIVTDFLARHPQFARVPATGAVPAALLTPAGDFQSLPQRHGMDGAYAARLARTR
ncbi:MAG: MFS transporter [Gemmatimonadetes bacterium]|nr:MAG: MFS transporter [Gemmatimonadota bacterium]